MAGVVWARGRLRELEDRYVIGGGGRLELEKEITELSLRFGVLCRFTAFVAVDRSEVVNVGGQVHSIVQPVEQPAGWAAPPGMHSDPGVGCAAAAAAPSMQMGALRGRLRQETLRAPQNLQFSKKPSLVEYLLSLSTASRRKVKTPPTVNREPYRQRLADALQAIRQHPTTDAGSRLDVLRALGPTLEAVFTEWTQAGEHDEAVRELGELVMAMQALLAQTNPADKAVAELWTRTEAAVQACLTLCGGRRRRSGRDSGSDGVSRAQTGVWARGRRR